MPNHTLTALILIGALFLYWAGFAGTSLVFCIGGCQTALKSFQERSSKSFQMTGVVMGFPRLFSAA
jgi:hypothetical protein